MKLQMAINGTLFAMTKTKNEIDSVEIFKSMMLEVNASGAVVMDGRNIAAGSIYANQLSAGSITATKIKAGEITTDHITTSGISADKIKAGTLTATNGASWINMNNGQFSFGGGKITYNGSTLIMNVDSLQIKSAAVATEDKVNEAVDAIDIGGVNKLRKDKWGAHAPYNTTPIVSDNIISFTKNNASGYSAINQTQGFAYGPDVVYTFSGIAKINGVPVTNSTWGTHKQASTYQGTVLKFKVDDATGKFIITQKWTSSSNWVFHGNIFPAALGAVITIEDFQMEKGTKDSAYHESPEDTSNKIGKAQETADNIKGIVSNFDSAIINANPIFLDWSSTFPAGYSSMTGSGLTKVTSGNGMGNALRFTVAAGANAYLNPDVITTFPFFEYVTIEITFKLDSGTIDGSGVLFRYRGTGITDEYVKFRDITPSPVLNKWYTITKVLKRTEPAGFTGYQVYPMGGFTSFGQTITAKVIQFDSLKTRKSTEQEINAYESSIMIDDMSVDSKITPVEKVQLKKEWATIASERSSLDGKAATFGITTEKTNMTNAYNTLNSILNGTSGILANMKTTSTVTATTFRAQFDDYYEKKAILQRKIDETSRALANTATDLAQAMTTGKMLFKDPTFKSGNNGLTLYNNTANGLVALTRITKPSDAPTTSTHAIQIRTTGAASPENGGFIQGFSSRANVKFVMRVIAKIPVGYTLKTASNPLGTGYTDTIITSDKGTGKYEEYIRLIQCGTTGTFSGGGHFYLSGPTPTAAAPLDWFVAYATTFDITDMDYTLSDIETLANVTKDKTDNWTYTGTTEINGGKIRADSVTATQIAANTITANQIATGAIIADKILANAITTAKIATNAVTANEIAAATITATEIKGGTITATQIAANAITVDKILANAVTTAKIATNAVTANEIAAGTITATEIKARTLTADRIATGAITANEIKANSITIGSMDSRTFSQGQITINPIFSEWPSTYPVGYIAWSSSPGFSKETVLTKNGGFGARFSVTATATNSGIQLTSAGTIDNQILPQYLVVEIDFMLVSGGISGAGVLIDWTGVTGTNRINLALRDEVPSPTLNKWYTIRKVVKAPSTTGAFTTMTGFLMANYPSSLGGGTIKNIIFDRWSLREPSIEEINTFGWTVAGTTEINGAKIRTGTLTADDIKTGKMTNTKGNVTLDLDAGKLSMKDASSTNTSTLTEGALDFLYTGEAFPISSRLANGSLQMTKKADMHPYTSEYGLDITMGLNEGYYAPSWVRLTRGQGFGFSMQNSQKIVLDVGEIDGKLSAASLGTGDAYFDTQYSSFQFLQPVGFQKGIVSTRISSGTNLNDVTDPGFYYNPSDAESGNIVNKPINNAFSLLVERHAGTKQTFTVYKTEPMMWIRNFYNGTWGGWKIVVDDSSWKQVSLSNVNSGELWYRYMGGHLNLNGWVDIVGEQRGARTVGFVPAIYAPPRPTWFVTAPHPGVTSYPEQHSAVWSASTDGGISMQRKSSASRFNINTSWMV